jgi:hypothetical protein
MSNQAGLPPFFPRILFTFGHAPAPAKHHPPRSPSLSFRAQQGISFSPLDLPMPHRLILSLPITQRFFAPPFGFALNDTLFSSPGLSPVYPLIPLTSVRAPAPAKGFPSALHRAGLSPVYPLRHRPLAVPLRPPSIIRRAHHRCHSERSEESLAHRLACPHLTSYGPARLPAQKPFALPCGFPGKRLFSLSHLAPGNRLSCAYGRWRNYSSSQSGRITGEKAKSRPW